MNFNEERQKRTEYIEEILKRYLPAKEGYQKIIMEAMEYSLMAGGECCIDRLWDELEVIIFARLLRYFRSGVHICRTALRT